MRGPSLTCLHFLALAACFTASAALCAQWDRKLFIPARDGVVLRAQAAGDEENYTSSENRIEAGTSQKISRGGSELKAEYRFVNFNKDRVAVAFSMPEPDYRAYLAGYGYSDAEISALRAWRDKTRQNVWKSAFLKGGRPAAEKAVAEAETDYDTRLRALMRARGLALRAGSLVECDMPAIVGRNTALLKPLALSFQQLASERGYAEEDVVGAALSLVQTALRYKIPPAVENGLHTGGLLPPARALLSGWGDCDSKTGLLASILGNWSGLRMVGIAVPGHYLMAIRRLPAKGDVFVRHEGLEYVLVEPAGPAWLEPGVVGSATTALLAGEEGYKVEPFF